MRKLWFLWMLVGGFIYGADVFDAVDKLTTQLEQPLKTKKLSRVGFLGFTHGNKEDSFGRFLSERVANAFQRKTGGGIVLRSHLLMIAEKNKLDLSDPTVPQTLMLLGEHARIDALGIGSYQLFGDNILIVTRLLDVKTGEQLGSAEVTFKRNEDLAAMLPATTSAKAPVKEVSIAAHKPRDNSEANSKTLNDFKFEFKRAHKQSDWLTCEILVTNLAEDRQLFFFGKNALSMHRLPKVVTDEGDSIPMSELICGGQTLKVGGWGVSHALHQFANGIPTKLKLRFKGNFEKVNRLALLEIVYKEKALTDNLRGFFDESASYQSIQMRNLPFKR